MRFTTKTEYGFVCLVYMARQNAFDKQNVVTINGIADAERLSEPYVAKILNRLRTAEIIVAHHGKQGGYALARKPSEITLKSIIEALEGTTFGVFCEPEIRHGIVCTHFSLCGMRPIWTRTKEVLDEFYNSVTLEMMAKNGEEQMKALLGGKS